jgi:hypothetical protein
MRKAVVATVLSFLMFGNHGVHAENVPIVISYQPNLYWSLPIYMATEKGWWKDVGLEPSFVTFPAGAPQIAAAAWRLAALAPFRRSWGPQIMASKRSELLPTNRWLIN